MKYLYSYPSYPSYLRYLVFFRSGNSDNSDNSDNGANKVQIQCRYSADTVQIRYRYGADTDNSEVSALLTLISQILPQIEVSVQLSELYKVFGILQIR